MVFFASFSLHFLLHFSAGGNTKMKQKWRSKTPFPAMCFEGGFSFIFFPSFFCRWLSRENIWFNTNSHICIIYYLFLRSYVGNFLGLYLDYSLINYLYYIFIFLESRLNCTWESGTYPSETHIYVASQKKWSKKEAKNRIDRTGLTPCLSLPPHSPTLRVTPTNC